MIDEDDSDAEEIRRLAKQEQ